MNNFERTETRVLASRDIGSTKDQKRLRQQEARLARLGATDVTIPKIQGVLRYFDDIEFSNAIPARDDLYKRLVALTLEERVPLVTFNCLDFAWEEDPNNYPLSRILEDTSTSICSYFANQTEATVSTLQSLSPDGQSGVDLMIIIPDSELFDSRVFRYAQDEAERLRIGERVKAELSGSLSSNYGINKQSVVFWSEYCSAYGLQSPTDYTSVNADRLLQASRADNSSPRERNVYRSLQKQMTDSRQYLMNGGLSSSYVDYGIPTEDQIQRTLWYCAMYMGEGQALSDSNAITLNFEDFRVSKWFNIGSEDRLPILTPVNPSEYYQWRNSTKRAAMDSV